MLPPTRTGPPGPLLLIDELATARGATPLVLVLQVGPEDAVEQALRRRIFDGAGLPGLLVEVDPAWRVPGDVHPDARAAHAIAAAVASRLRASTTVTATTMTARSSRSPS